METGLLHAHSGLRYLVFLALILVLVKSILNVLGKKEWSKGDSKFTMFLMAFSHLQFLIGLGLYFVKDYQGFFSNMSQNMGVDTFRWAALEHPLTMIIFLILVTIMHSVNKRERKNKNRRALIITISALVTALSGIPFDRWF
ncbi:MAG: hypothetical protein ACPGLV_07975 [Bacteroidia bacterium]